MFQGQKWRAQLYITVLLKPPYLVRDLITRDTQNTTKMIQIVPVFIIFKDVNNKRWITHVPSFIAVCTDSFVTMKGYLYKSQILEGLQELMTLTHST